MGSRWLIWFTSWHYLQGFRFRFFDASGLVPPPTLWTDASGFSVDASGLVPPIRFGQGGTGGTAHTLLKMPTH